MSDVHCALGRRFTRSVWLAITTLALLAGVAAGPALADSPGSGPDFDQVVRAASVVTVATVVQAQADGSATIRTERVLKGRAADFREFSPDDKAVHLTRGERVVLIQMDPRGLDFRGTYALRVASNGGLNGDGLRGAPATIAQLEAHFDLPATDTVALEKTGATQPAGWLVLVGLGLCLLAAAWQQLARRGPGRLGRDIAGHT